MRKIWIVLCSFLLVFLCNFKVAKANNFENIPYQTKIVGLNKKLVNSSVAYEGILVLSPDFVEPTDIVVDKENNVYISDKGKKLVYKYFVNEKKFISIGEGTLEGPTGIAIDTDLNLYVADYDKKEIIVFDKDHQIINTFGKPTAPIYGVENDFRPTKVAVDRAKNIYVTSEGNANGLIRITDSGEFMGYFAPNQVKVTLNLLLKRMFLSKEDKDVFASLNPKASTNLFVDERNVVYTVIDKEEDVSLKKFNIQGNNILANDPYFTNSYKDITVDSDGFIYAIDNENSGCISVIDTNGNLLFKFGSTTLGSMSVGQFDSPIGIAVDQNKNIWALDSTGKNIQVFARTEFANKIMNAKIQYNLGNYDEAKILYEEIIRENSSFVEAYNGLGEIAQRNLDFHEALKYFKIANNTSGYSDAFWEIRDQFIGKYLVLLAILLLSIFIIKTFKLHLILIRKIPSNIVESKNKIKNQKWFMEISYLKQMLKRPSDVFYDIKYQHKIRLTTALILFGVYLLIVILSDYIISGYLFRKGISGDVNLSFELLKWGLALFLFSIANHLISSLQNGEGFYRDIFIGTIYSFAPVFLFYLPLSIVSNALTFNESFLYQLATIIIWGWSFFNLIIMIKNVHNYKIGQLLANILLTIITMIILILIYLIVYILFMQFYDFIIGIISEVLR